MKFTGIVKGDFKQGTLRIEGVTVQKEPSFVEIDVPDKAIFLGWLSATLYENDISDPKSNKGFDATSIAFSAHADETNGFALVFTFGLDGGALLRFRLPVATKSLKRLAAVHAHLEQALKEMEAQEGTPPPH